MSENPAERDGDIASGHGNTDSDHITDSAAEQMIRAEQSQGARQDASPDPSAPAEGADTALDAPASPWGPYAAATETGATLDGSQALGTSGQDTADASGGGGGSGW